MDVGWRKKTKTIGKYIVDEYWWISDPRVLFAGRQIAFGQAAARICSCATGNHIYFGPLEVGRGHIIKSFIKPFRTRRSPNLLSCLTIPLHKDQYCSFVICKSSTSVKAMVVGPPCERRWGPSWKHQRNCWHALKMRRSTSMPMLDAGTVVDGRGGDGVWLWAGAGLESISMFFRWAGY